MGMLSHRKPTQVSNDLQNMLVHRVDMEEVVLHLAHDAAKHGQHATQNAQVIQDTQRMHNSARLLKHFEQQGLMLWVVSVALINRVAMVPECPQRAGCHASAAGRLLHGQKGLQHGRGSLGKDLVVADIEQSAYFLKVVVDGPGLGSRVTVSAPN